MIRVHGYLGTISDALREEVTQADLVVGGHGGQPLSFSTARLSRQAGPDYVETSEIVQ